MLEEKRGSFFQSHQFLLIFVGGVTVLALGGMFLKLTYGDGQGELTARVLVADQVCPRWNYYSAYDFIEDPDGNLTAVRWDLAKSGVKTRISDKEAWVVENGRLLKKPVRIVQGKFWIKKMPWPALDSETVNVLKRDIDGDGTSDQIYLIEDIPNPDLPQLPMRRVK